jgi:predicted enzyme related to lactoylglutathione lyase
VLGRLEEIVVDCHDPERLVRFWAEVLGGEPVDRDPNWSYVDPPGSPRLAFQRVPEPKPGAKNRLHLDVYVEDIPPAARRLTERGAAPVGGIVRGMHGAFQILADPEGNEFCLVTE